MSTNITKWVIDPTHTEIGFKVKHLMIANVRGNFKQFEGYALTSGSDFNNAQVEFSVNTTSVDTQMPDRDAHLRSADFFHSEAFPELTFKSTSMAADGDGGYKMAGLITIRDVTKEIVLDVENGGMMKDPWGNEKAGFTITGKINRRDFGLNWNAALEAGGVLVGEEVRIQCDVELAKVAA